MLVSIIIPVYNVEKYVEKCLRSVIAQDFTGGMECIIVDDCGDDGSMAICNRVISEYEGTIDFKVVRHNCNKGLSCARNTGMSNAKGDYYFFLDSDDAITENCVSIMTEGLMNESFDVVAADIVHSVEHNKHLYVSYENDICFKGCPLFKKGEKIGIPFMAWNKLYRAKFIKDNNLKFKEGLIHEDLLWTFMVICSANSMKVYKDQTYFYNHSEHSIVAGNLNYHHEVLLLLEIINDMREFVVDKGIKHYPHVCSVIDNMFWMALSNASMISRSYFNKIYDEIVSKDIYTKMERIQFLNFRIRSVLKKIVLLFPLFLSRRIFYRLVI